MYLVPKRDVLKRDFGAPVVLDPNINLSETFVAYSKGIHAATNGQRGQKVTDVVKDASVKNNWQGSEKLVALIEQHGSLLAFEAERTGKFLGVIGQSAPDQNTAELYEAHHREADEVFFGITDALLSFVRGFERASGVTVRV